jgi:2-keto-3-deoxy-L-rhamnonate aldolase RhmA
MEHSPFSIETVADMALAARALDLPLLVRPPVGSREWITRILDSGAWGVYVPQVDTAEQVREVVEASRHAPLGNRGTFEPGPQNDYTEPSDSTGSLRFLNDQVHVTVILESKAAFENLEAILEVEGIDAVGVGAADLAQDLGVYDTPHEQTIIDNYREQLIEAAKAKGKAVSIFVTDLEQADRWKRAGATMICYQTDAWALRVGFAAAVQHCRSYRTDLTNSTA